MKLQHIFSLILIFLVAFMNSVRSQGVKQNYSDREACTKTQNKKFEEISKLYPFNTTSKIILVSCKDKPPINEPKSVGEDLMNYTDSIHIGKDYIDHSRFTEIHTLTLTQIVQLADIIYNYGYKYKNHSASATKCYEPKNAIFFIDQNDRILGFIEICFECNKTRTNDKVNIGEECEQKYDLLKKLFMQCGIKYGITEF